MFYKVVFSVNKIPNYLLEAITGLMLSDGHMRSTSKSIVKEDGTRVFPGNCRLEFTFKKVDTPQHILDAQPGNTKGYTFVRWLKLVVLAEISTSTEPGLHEKKKVKSSQYWFSTRALPLLTDLCALWYKPEIVGISPRTKVLPPVIHLKQYFTGVTLAFWIMGDGYWHKAGKTVFLCVQSFTEAEVKILASLLETELGLVSAPQVRTWENEKTKVTKTGYELRFSQTKENLSLLRQLVTPYMHPSMLYKLGEVEMPSYVKENETPEQK